jgi:hypothetical protein
MKTLTVDMKDTDFRYLDWKARAAGVYVGEYVTDLLQMWIKSSKLLDV